MAGKPAADVRQAYMAKEGLCNFDPVAKRCAEDAVRIGLLEEDGHSERIILPCRDRAANVWTALPRLY